jgi:hypothetical protein
MSKDFKFLSFLCFLDVFSASGGGRHEREKNGRLPLV